MLFIVVILFTEMKNDFMKLKWIVRLEITVNESLEDGLCMLNADGTETFCKHGLVRRLPKAIRYYKRKYPEMKYKIVFFPRLNSFFTFFLKQNDYLFPSNGENAESYPFKKPHLWKTRIGFRTAWNLSK